MPKTILIVDDEQDTRRVLDDILTHHGYKVVKAANGKEALEKAREARPDAILLDTKLPDGPEGYKVCRRIKEIKGLNTKVIVYTGYVDAIDAEKAKAAGADDYVVKTEDFSHMLEAIKKLI